jgi:gamma-D-glutamyl-L-lysine dipeptidyl-peptidase
MFGIAKLSIIPCRAEASDKAEITTQLLFGEVYKVIIEEEKWMQIETQYDNYQCWIDKKQFSEITEEDYRNFSINDFPVATSISATLTNEDTNEQTHITTGASLPFFHQNRCKIRNTYYKYSGEVCSFKTDDLERYARMYLNAPYLWGGRHPFGIDCSGFSQIVYKMCGLKILRDARQQAEQGDEVKLENANLGDLAFFHNPQGKITHVGILLDNKTIIHASGQVRIDAIDSTGIYKKEIKDYSHQLSFVKRFF